MERKLLGKPSSNKTHIKSYQGITNVCLLEGKYGTLAIWKYPKELRINYVVGKRSSFLGKVPYGVLPTEHIPMYLCLLKLFSEKIEKKHKIMTGEDIKLVFTTKQHKFIQDCDE